MTAGKHLKPDTPGRSSSNKSTSRNTHGRGIGSRLQDEVSKTVEQQRYAFDGISKEILALKQELEREKVKNVKLSRELREWLTKESEMKSELAD